jgi:cell division protein FtsQ
MDDRGRLAQPLSGTASRGLAERAIAPAPPHPERGAAGTRSHPGQAVDRCSWLFATRLPRGAGIAATVVFILASVAYGTIKGDHVGRVVDAVEEVRDRLANIAGFGIVSIALAGNTHVSREEVLAIAGITGSTSLAFLDVERVRARLKTNPWIADAGVLKLYPGQLRIEVKERAAFALWQKDHRVSVIADDGTVLEPYVAPALVQLPLVVGSGAQTRAKAFLAMLDRHPAMRDFVRAAVLVGERRWNLRLKNGIDVQLPESDVAAALERLVRLDGEKNLITRDIAVIDLRLPDRVTVRLSDAAAQARFEALKDKSRKKGGNA